MNGSHVSARVSYRWTSRFDALSQSPRQRVEQGMTPIPEATHRVQVTNVKELVPAIRDFIVRRGSR